MLRALSTGHVGTTASVSHSFSYESGLLENPKAEAPLDLYLMTKHPKDGPEQPTRLQIDFKKGTYSSDLRFSRI